MKKRRHLLSSLLAVSMLLAAAPFALAAMENTEFSDVAAGAWYADAVDYVRDKGLMSGTGDTTFSPDVAASRSMLAVILYRAEGSPEVNGGEGFADVAADAYYHDAAVWAEEAGVMSGYGGGLFGGNDPITREQLVTILWRYTGSPDTDAGRDFVDEAAISAFAKEAVDWSRSAGVVGGLVDGRFDPQGTASRAQVAVILRNFMSSVSAETPDIPSEGSRTIVAYFSATGSTGAVAEYIAQELGADLYEIVPEMPYTPADLNWNDTSSRVNDEHNTPDARPAIAGETPNLEKYDTVFLGYPIWWGEAPNILRTFLERVDLSGKTVIPFCTSASSGFGSSGETLQAFASDAEWLDGQRFSSGADQSAVVQWVQSLNIPAASAMGLEGRN